MTQPLMKIHPAILFLAGVIIGAITGNPFRPMEVLLSLIPLFAIGGFVYLYFRKRKDKAAKK